MGGNCSSACGDNCCKKDDATAQATNPEYAPERGATEESNAELEDFVKEVAAAKLVARNEVKKDVHDKPPEASDVTAGIQNIIEGLGGKPSEETTEGQSPGTIRTPKSAREGGESPGLTLQHEEEGHTSPRPDYDDDAQREAARQLKEACRTNPQSVARIENAIAVAKEAGVGAADLEAAEKHLERIKVIVGIHRAAEAGDPNRVKTLIAEAKQLGGVPEREVEKAMETLHKVQIARKEAERQKSEEEAQKRTALQQKQLASSALRSAIQERNREKLEIALEQAREHDVPFDELELGAQVLTELQKKKGCACCGGGGGGGKKGKAKK